MADILGSRLTFASTDTSTLSQPPDPSDLLFVGLPAEQTISPLPAHARKHYMLIRVVIAFIH